MRNLLIATTVAAGLFLLPGSAGNALLHSAQQHQHAQEQQHAHGRDMDEACREMMAHHQEMMEQMTQMDGRLDQLVADMNAAQGQARVDAIAAVVSEMVVQRRTMRDRMMTMHQRMMGHMMEHMGEGHDSMSACPMMKMMKK
jgi:hypothetical protein